MVEPDLLRLQRRAWRNFLTGAAEGANTMSIASSQEDEKLARARRESAWLQTRLDELAGQVRSEAEAVRAELALKGLLAGSQPEPIGPPPGDEPATASDFKNTAEEVKKAAAAVRHALAEYERAPIVMRNPFGGSRDGR